MYSSHFSEKQQHNNRVKIPTSLYLISPYATPPHPHPVLSCFALFGFHLPRATETVLTDLWEYCVYKGNVHFQVCFLSLSFFFCFVYGETCLVNLLKIFSNEKGAEISVHPLPRKNFLGLSWGKNARLV